MKRELANNALSLMEKAQAAEVGLLERRVQSEYPTLKAFSQLQATVGGKAEWLDLNDVARRHQQTVEALAVLRTEHDKSLAEYEDFRTRTQALTDTLFGGQRSSDDFMKKLESTISSQAARVGEVSAGAVKRIEGLS
jgi:hypothetical protein